MAGILSCKKWDLGVSKHTGTPKWMVYSGKPYFLMDDLGVKPTIFGNSHLGGEMPFLNQMNNWRWTTNPPFSTRRPQDSRFVVLDLEVAPRRPACGVHAAPHVTRIVGPHGPWVLVTWQCFTKHQINEELTWKMDIWQCQHQAYWLQLIEMLLFGSEFKLMDVTHRSSDQVY